MNGNIVNSCGFPQSKRINHSHQYRFLLKNGKKLVTEHLICYFIHTGYNFSRLGITVAKNKIPLAVWRNRTKRIIKESFRKKLFQKQYDIIVSVNRSFQQLSKNSQGQCLVELWKEIESEKK